uniref:Uncharacterized protein n=1 Tax=Leersia perrieri TaxID=77586 RepID=A0A0D9WMF7_9ORYZ
MDPMFSSMEWTAVEKGKARSVVSRLNNNFDVVSASNSNNDDTRHDRIVRELEALFPWMTKNQVSNSYVDTVVDMMMAPTLPYDIGTVARTNSEPMKVNFGMLSREDPMNSVDLSMNNYNNMVFGDASIGDTVEQASPAPMVVNGSNEVNQGNSYQPAAPNSGKSKFWTHDEHMMFLMGVDVYGRGDWKNISKFFVPSKTPSQVSSHAQKYFRRQKTTDKKQRYSINDVVLKDAKLKNPLDNNNYGSWQALAFAGGHLQPTSGYGTTGCVAPPANSTSSVTAMNNIAQFWAPLLYNSQTQQQFTQMQMQPQQAWNDQQMMGTAALAPMEGAAAWNAAPMEGGAAWNNQQMMGAIAAPMEGAADNFAPAGRAADNFAPVGGSGYYQQEQGTGYDVPAEPWMMNNNMF